MQNSKHNRALRNIVILEGGSAGWMTAAELSKFITRDNYSIQVVEENDFLKYTQGTFKLGIEFIDWHSNGTAYMHPLGDYGTSMNGVPFHHYWLKSQKTNQKDYINQHCKAKQ